MTEKQKIIRNVSSHTYLFACASILQILKREKTAAKDKESLLRVIPLHE